MKRLKRNFAAALALGVGVYLALVLVSGMDSLREALDRFDWKVIPYALVLVGISYAVRYVRWSYFLHRLGVHLGRRADVAIFTAGLSMTVSPGKLGEILKSALILEVSGTPVSKTAPAVITERATDGIGMAVWGLLGALAFSYKPSIPIVFLTITVVGIVVLRSKRLSTLLADFLGLVPGLKRLAPHMADFHNATNQLLAPVPLVIGSVLAFVIWFLEIWAVYLIVRGVGATVPFLEIAFIFAVSSIVGLLSMLPGGVGAAEASLAGMFRAVAGLASGPAALVTLIIRLVTLWFAAFLGVLGLAVAQRFITKAKGTPW